MSADEQPVDELTAFRGPLLRVTLRNDGTVAIWQREGRSASELADILRRIADGFEHEPRRIG